MASLRFDYTAAVIQTTVATSFSPTFIFTCFEWMISFLSFSILLEVQLAWLFRTKCCGKFLICQWCWVLGHYCHRHPHHRHPYHQHPLQNDQLIFIHWGWFCRSLATTRTVESVSFYERPLLPRRWLVEPTGRPPATWRHFGHYVWPFNLPSLWRPCWRFV